MADMNSNDKPPEQFLFTKAPVARRFGAYLVDFGILTVIFNFPFNMGLIFVVINGLTPDGPIGVLITFCIILLIIFLALGFRDTIKGQSIGKRVLGIGVRDVSDNFVVPSTSRLFLRQIFWIISPIEFLVLVFSNDNRKIGDKIAGTDVYNVREYEEFINNAKHAENIKQA